MKGNNSEVFCNSNVIFISLHNKLLVLYQNFSTETTNARKQVNFDLYLTKEEFWFDHNHDYYYDLSYCND